MDLLKPADLDKDRVDGKWTRSGDTVVVSGRAQGRLLLSVRVEGGYEVAFEFTRNSGNGLVGITLPVGDAQCLLVLDWEGSSGIEQIDGARANRNSTTRKTGKLQNNRRYTASVRVRLIGDDAAIEVSLDGTDFIRWSGEPASLSLNGDWMVPKQKRPGLAANVNPNATVVTFHSARFRLLSGKASWVRPAGS